MLEIINTTAGKAASAKILPLEYDSFTSQIYRCITNLIIQVLSLLYPQKGYKKVCPERTETRRHLCISKTMSRGSNAKRWLRNDAAITGKAGCSQDKASVAVLWSDTLTLLEQEKQIFNLQHEGLMISFTQLWLKCISGYLMAFHYQQWLYLFTCK